MHNAISTFRDAVENEDYKAAWERADPLLNDMEQQLKRCNSLQFASEVLLSKPEITGSDEETVSNVKRDIRRIEEGYREISGVIREIAAGSVEQSEALKVIDDQLDARESLDQSVDQLSSTNIASQAGHIVTVEPEENVEIAKGGSAAASVVLTNGGGEITPPVTVTTQSHLDIQLGSERSLDSIKPGESKRTAIPLSGDLPSRSYSIDIVVNVGSEDPIKQDTQVSVSDEFRYLDTVYDELESISQRIRDLSNQLQYDSFYHRRISSVQDTIRTIQERYLDGVGADTQQSYASMYNNISYVLDILEWESEIHEGVHSAIVDELESAEDTLKIAEEAELCYINRSVQALNGLRVDLLSKPGIGEEVDILQGAREDIDKLARTIATGNSGYEDEFDQISQILRDTLLQKAEDNPDITGEDLENVQDTVSRVTTYLSISKDRYT